MSGAQGCGNSGQWDRKLRPVGSELTGLIPWRTGLYRDERGGVPACGFCAPPARQNPPAPGTLAPANRAASRPSQTGPAEPRGGADVLITRLAAANPRACALPIAAARAGARRPVKASAVKASASSGADQTSHAPPSPPCAPAAPLFGRGAGPARERAEPARRESRRGPCAGGHGAGRPAGMSTCTKTWGNLGRKEGGGTKWGKGA